MDIVNSERDVHVQVENAYEVISPSRSSLRSVEDCYSSPSSVTCIDDKYEADDNSMPNMDPQNNTKLYDINSLVSM